MYRSGRQAEALEAYRAARAALVGELGIEPGRRLRDLHEAILRQDAELELAAPRAGHAPPAAREPGARAFVGRGSELAQLLVALGDAFAGSGRLVLLAGEPGIGKSRLVDALADHARARGARVLVGRCWEAGGAPAYWPWVQALRPYVRASDAATLAAHAGSGAAELAQLVPELGERIPGLPPPSTLEPELVRFRLFDAAAELLSNAAAERPIVLVIDDLQAADPPSLLLLRFVARTLTTARLLVVCAYRDVDPVPAQELAETLAEVAREHVTRRIALGGLTEPEVAEYLALTAPETAAPHVVRAVHERTEGNPLFVGEIARLLALEDGEPGPGVPRGIRDVIARRLGHLDEASRRLLVLASVLGREFRLDMLAALGDVPDDELLTWLDGAIAAGVVAEVPGSPGRLRFEHELFRDALYEGLSAARRVRLHGRVVEALERLEDGAGGSLLAELAAHAIAAGDPEAGLRHARAAAGRALEAHAFEEAARLLGLALEALDLRPPVDPLARCELLLAAGEALASAGSTAEARDRFLAAAALARSARLPEALARAGLGYGGRTYWLRAAGDARLVPLLEEGLGGEVAPELRARLLARLAGALRDEPAVEPRAALSREAVAIARTLDDPELLATALTAHFMAAWGPDPADLVPIAEEVRRLAARTKAPASVLDALTLDSIVAWLTLAEADAASLDDRFDALAEDLGEAAPRWAAAIQSVVWALFRGDFAAAERLAEEALPRGGERRTDAECSYRLAMFVLCREQGRLAEIEPLVREAAVAYPGYRSFRCFVPLMDLELGRVAAARRSFDVLAEDGFAALPRDGEWLFCLSHLAEVAAGLDDVRAAAVLYDLMRPYERVNVMAVGEIAIGPAARFLGILATAIGRREDAEAHFEAAIAMNARMVSRPWLAHAQEDYARMLRARGRPGDAERARDLLAACGATYRELGMRPATRSAGAPARRPRPARP